MLHAYRYTFNDDIKHADILETYDLARLAIESIYGDARVRLETGHAYRNEDHIMCIAGNDIMGKAINLVFTGLAARRHGTGSFVVEPVDTDSAT